MARYCCRCNNKLGIFSSDVNGVCQSCYREEQEHARTYNRENINIKKFYILTDIYEGEDDKEIEELIELEDEKPIIHVHESKKTAQEWADAIDDEGGINVKEVTGVSSLLETINRLNFNPNLHIAMRNKMISLERFTLLSRLFTDRAYVALRENTNDFFLLHDEANDSLIGFLFDCKDYGREVINSLGTGIPCRLAEIDRNSSISYMFRHVPNCKISMGPRVGMMPLEELEFGEDFFVGLNKGR